MASRVHLQKNTVACFTNKCVCSIVIVVVFIFQFVVVTVFILHHTLRSRPEDFEDKREMARLPKGFEERLTRPEKTMMMDTIDIFSDCLTRASIPFFMYGGTLLGSWRHHGLVPWDDDVDFAVPFDLKENISQILDTLKPTFILNKKQIFRWKLYHCNATKIAAVDWSFPFLDISFFHLNDTHVWDEDAKNYKNFIFPKDVVFPLSFRPFEGRQLPSPSSAKAMLAQNYDVNNCNIGPYSHRLEKFESVKWKANCSELYASYPFVDRVPAVNSTCNETLLLNGQVLDWIVVENEEC